MHAVFAAKHHRQRTGLQDMANTGLNVVVARDGVSMHDIGIAYIDDGYAIGGQVNDIVFIVVGAATSASIFSQSRQTYCLAKVP